MRWLKRWLREEAPPPPVLLRVADPAGRPVGAVEVGVTWFPSGHTAARRHHTAAGLCVVPWLRAEERARLTLRTDAGEAIFEIDRDRPDGGRVHEVALTTPSAPARACG